MLSPKLQARLKAAVARHVAEDYDGASRIYEEIRAVAPHDFQINHLLGALRHQQGRSGEALVFLERALRSAPRSASTHMCFGLALSAVGRSEEAEKSLGTALTLSPLDPEIWSNLAVIYAVRGRTPEAIASFRRALEIQPGYVQGWMGLGSVLHAAGRSAEAVEALDRALALDPGSATARFPRAQALIGLHRLDEALAEFDRHLVLRPQHHQARSFRLFLLNYLDGLSREQVLAEHLAYGKAVEGEAGPAASVQAPRAPDPARPLRIAFLSPDLRQHSVVYFLEPILAHLDRSQFEVFLYHDHYVVDAASERLRAQAACWRHFTGWSNAAVETAIRADAPDILLDLAGHTGFNRLEIFAQRLAPVQLTYLGYPGTTGLAAMDHRLTDAVADPVGESEPFHTENLVRFAPTAWSYAPPAEAPEPALPPGLRGEPITFGSFNTLAKASPTTLELWREILAVVPDARLVLKSAGMETEPWRRRLAAAGLPVDRIDLLPLAPDVAGHLACYSEVDVALDSFPYNGTTTTCEALWMGVPVVTLAGDRHVSRVGASLLTAIGRPEWIAHSRADYVRLAMGLALDAGLRRTLRTGLRDLLRVSPLLDHPGQAERFGAALHACWRQRCGESGVRREEEALVPA